MGGQVKVCPGGLKIDDGFITGNGGHGFSRFPESRWRTKAVGIDRVRQLYLLFVGKERQRPGPEGPAFMRLFSEG
jgi:hypothetical protein